MARTPSIPEADLQRLSAFVASQGYDLAKLQRVPQQPALYSKLSVSENLRQVRAKAAAVGREIG